MGVTLSTMGSTQSKKPIQPILPTHPQRTVCISTMTCYDAFVKQPPLTKKYVFDILELLMDTNAEFTLYPHESAMRDYFKK